MIPRTRARPLAVDVGWREDGVELTDELAIRVFVTDVKQAAERVKD